MNKFVQAYTDLISFVRAHPWFTSVYLTWYCLAWLFGVMFYPRGFVYAIVEGLYAATAITFMISLSFFVIRRQLLESAQFVRKYKQWQSIKKTDPYALSSNDYYRPLAESIILWRILWTLSMAFTALLIVAMYDGLMKPSESALLNIYVIICCLCIIQQIVVGWLQHNTFDKKEELTDQ